MRALGLLLGLSLATSGCLRGALVDARVSAANDSEASLDTLQDYEIGSVGAAARISELEGLLAASAADSRVLLLLARAWCRYTFEVTLDAHEQALEAGDAGLAGYHLERAQAGFGRAAYYADTWLEQSATGFAKATESDAALAAFLDKHFHDADAGEALLWAGFARIGKARSLPTPTGALGATLGRRLLERSLQLAPSLALGVAHLILAVEATRDPTPNFETARREFALADAGAKQQRLLVPVLRARTLFCLQKERASFERELHAALGESDANPRLRLENAAAKRRARRYLTSPLVAAECFGDAAAR